MVIDFRVSSFFRLHAYTTPRINLKKGYSFVLYEVDSDMPDADRTQDKQVVPPVMFEFFSRQVLW